MKKAVILFILVSSLSSCSLMQKMMVKRMEKMPEEKKMEMMSKMMGKSDCTACNEIMNIMMEMNINDSLSMADRASVMMPMCLDGILSAMDDSLKAPFLIDISKKIIVNGFDSLPPVDKPLFKKEMEKTIVSLK